MSVSNKRWKWAASVVTATATLAGFLVRLYASDECGVDEGVQQVNAAVATAERPAPLPLQVVHRQEQASLVARPAPVTVQRLDDEAFGAALRDEPKTLGAFALGRPNRGSLFNGAQLSNTDPRWKLEVPEHAYGTEETVRGIEAAVAEVNRLFPNTPALSIGHLSSEQGGRLRPHRSHQNGRDVDLGFYYNDGSPWYRKATADNLDVARTWALLSALERAAGLEYAFVDQSLHAMLRQHAEAIGESVEFIEHMFDGPLPVRGPTIRHERGHLTHLHVRFVSPIAVENALRLRGRAGKGGRNSSGLALLVQQRQLKQRVVADRRLPKQRAARSGYGRAKGASASRTKLL